jgi:hypothetical protein
LFLAGYFVRRKFPVEETLPGFTRSELRRRCAKNCMRDWIHRSSLLNRLASIQRLSRRVNRLEIAADGEHRTGSDGHRRATVLASGT